MFRAPTTPASASAAYYEHEYESGMTTELPSDAELARLVETSFAGTEKDYSGRLAVLRALGCQPGDAVVDFGCSWGYGSWQLAQAGYSVTGVEVSPTRGSYASEKLGVNVERDPANLRTGCDVFFSSHVIEHVPSVSEVLELARRVTRPGGLFVAFSPNGSAPLRARDPQQWQRFWGIAHSNLMDDVFYHTAFAADAHLVLTDPYEPDVLKGWAGGDAPDTGRDLDGYELLLVARLGSTEPSSHNRRPAGAAAAAFAGEEHGTTSARSSDLSRLFR